MPDQFKKFLQTHRTELDKHSVPQDLFEKIMDRTFIESESRTSLVKVNFRSILLPLLSIAAVGLILCIAYFGLRNNESSVVPSVLVIENNSAKSSNTNLSSKDPTQTSTSEQKNQDEQLSMVKLNNSNITPHRAVSDASASNLTSPKLINKFNKVSEFDHQSNTVKNESPELETVAVINMNSDSAIGLQEKNVEKIASVQTNNTEVEQEMTTLPIIEKLDIKTSVSNPKVSSPIANNDERGMHTLDQKIKKGFFSFLSNKSRQWSNNKLAIDPVEQDRSTYLAIAFKNNQLEFNKSLKFNY
ncbi:MAG: hypothetical protein ABI851_09340 [Saprospiraceae bacterium]